MINYFEFFDLPVAFDLDQGVLRKRFIINSKKYHPDFHTSASEEEQEEVLEKSTINNQAWKTLLDPLKRMAHVLLIKGVMPEEGQAKIPQEFLMEMMDINEALMELEFDPDPSKSKEVLASISTLEETLHKEGKAAMAAWDEDQEDGFLEVVRDYYLKLKYVGRIREKVG